MKLFKDKKTTIVGIIGAILVLVAIVSVLIGKAALMEVSSFLGGLSAILISFVAFLSRDSKRVNETVNNSVNPQESLEVKKGVIPGRGIKEPPKKYDN